MRYYLIVETEYLKIDESGNPQSDKYNELINKLNSLGHVINTNVETMRKSVDGTMGIIEIHSLEKYIDKNKIGQMIEVPFSFYTTDEAYTERALVEERLEQLKLDGLIIAYGHYPHLSDGRQACIHCYLKENADKWQPKEEI